MEREIQPLVTIGIPNYNYAQYLEECISSVVNQTYSNIEILISDNASTDNSIDVIKSFNDPRIRYWVNKANLGVYPNWDLLVKEAKGEYFKILQADDFLDINYVTKCIEILVKNDADCAFPGCNFIGSSQPTILPSNIGFYENSYLLTDEDISQKAFSLTIFVHPTIGLYKSKLVPEGFGGTNKNMNRDMVYWAKAITRGKTILINEVLCTQRMHEKQDRRRKDTSMAIIDMFDAADILNLNMGAETSIKAFKKRIAFKFFGFAVKRMVYGDFKIAYKTFKNLIEKKHLFVGTIEFLKYSFRIKKTI